MYILGHAYLARGLRTVDYDHTVTTGARALMLPDYADSHAYAYTCAWSADSTTSGRLIRSHIAGDWWVHFGGELTEPARRRGWAYQRMGVVARTYEDFYRTAFERGLTDTPEPNDSRRGWAHSMLEYSIDTYLARKGTMDEEFHTLRAELGDLGRNAAEVTSLFESHQVHPWSQETWRHATDYALRVALSEAPEDLAIIGAVGKFGLDYSAGSRALVRDYQHRIVDEIDDDEYEALLADMADFVLGVDDGHLVPAVPGPPAKTRAVPREAGHGR